MATIRQLVNRTPTHATGELREVPRKWIQCSTCRRLLKWGHQAMHYKPNRVWRCAECVRREPDVRTYEDADPGMCSNCFQPTRELYVTLTINGRDIDVCELCARGADQIEGVTSRPAKPKPKRSLFDD